MVQLKRFESKISSEFRKRAKLVIFWLFGENGNFFAKAKKALRECSLFSTAPPKRLIFHQRLHTYPITFDCNLKKIDEVETFLQCAHWLITESHICTYWVKRDFRPSLPNTQSGGSWLFLCVFVGHPQCYLEPQRLRFWSSPELCWGPSFGRTWKLVKICKK